MLLKYPKVKLNPRSFQSLSMTKT